ncbi:Crp/Fnr family transcriptional regulator [Solirhodobacter olei]|uniref:Crp/Fnr family transcriptional regulator n=1 Tax=Solirhodobacter olei TaxID=2493082 RepID=UPI000FDB99A0|nr:Crp/Fnr family transcriptional regulator [Solirhodobacter olei]
MTRKTPNPGVVKMGDGGPDDRFQRLLEAFPEPLRDRLTAELKRVAMAEGTVLVEDGDTPSQIGYVLSGLLGMTKHLPDGRRHIIGLLAPTDMYGRFHEQQFSHRIEALAPSEVLTCPRDLFETLLREAPAAERLFLIDMLDELDAAREWLLVLGGPKVVQRVASFLLVLSRRKLRARGRDAAAHDQPLNLRLDIRRADLAQYLGARAESLSRAFHELAEAGAIRINDPYDFDVTDLEGLAYFAGHDLAADSDYPGPGDRDP